MNWESLPTWIKGGIIGAIPIILLWIAMPIILLFVTLEYSYWITLPVVLVLSSLYLLPLIIIGIFIGWLIGRKKSK